MHHRQTYRWAIFALLFCALLGIAPTTLAAPQAAQAVAATEQATIYLVAIGDNGQSGTKIGCGDSLIPVTVNVPTANTTAGKITQALTALFAIKQQFYGQSGLEDSLYQSNLAVNKVELQGGVAAVYLSGSLTLGGVCDDPRAEGQITATAMHLPGVTQAIVVFNGGPLT
ncbi:MAG: GerMN domain-containing protein, partial [Thermomicrobiales bacterium]